ncbi:chemotaxis protein CheB [Mycolicibacterium moriokaense]|jgi:two-component system chemotaxis response regulator CheB|uniref:protein-glutamate methylesterase n=1 Tax=Mycolicibacterium moriokaense TaxID=39691 RepID=A0AAD1M8T5_9MYCO|nr:chemotaxis protein CheB [Mycolicibacterium moriokaense]MCV7039348.1 chemotaxis protein CheB [Mycolicibacterium moriokaense]ORB26820.1 chemotaxis protein CheB [Mycolicibacterium moriokaense]BBX03871.1 chemotaxis protein CheB [Mycolicibacterium moriokaense]
MSGPDVVVIGGSAGGIGACTGIFETLENIGESVVCVVLHRAPQYAGLVEVLQDYTAIPVHEPNSSPWACPLGAVTVSPAGYHLLLGNDRVPSNEPQTPIEQYETRPGVRAHLTLDEPVAYSRPSIDVVFSSAAHLVNSVTAVLLSCANDDGARGCEAVKAAGGRVVLQDPDSCQAPVAVNAAMRLVEPDHVADPPGIGRWLSGHG